uniref:Uncharacterized protein n=1 Tax=Pseudoderbesia arbuscula TaxID=2320809 RepID=A0A386AYT3_9CHLO|nr:hypothetical protein [Pseudoderbesia arbuscula]
MNKQWTDAGLKIIPQLNLDSDKRIDICEDLYRKTLTSGLQYLQEFENDYLMDLLKNHLQIPDIYSGRWLIANKILKTIEVWSSDLNDSHFQLKMIEKSEHIKPREFVKQIDTFSFLIDNFMRIVSSTPYN